MEIRVNCNNLITLNSFKNLKLIRLGVLSYNLNKATLTGDVKVSGEYFKEDNTEMGFEDIVPFTVVFRNEKVKIEKVFIDNDIYNTKDIQGVDVTFDLVVVYSLIEEENNSNDKPNEEDNKEDEIIIEVPVEVEDDSQMVQGDVIDELIEEAEKITKEYDELLSKVLNSRNDEVELEPNDYQEIEYKEDEETKLQPKYSNVNIIKDNNKVSFKNQSTTNNKVTVYYVNKENELETISKERRISINDIYKTNSDFEKTRRIIINE